jgi:hypothetical protein
MFLCRSCRGWQLLLPVAAKVTKNAFALAKPLGASVCTATTISLKTASLTRVSATLAPALETVALFCRVRATARHTPQALCTPRGESASAKMRGIHEKDKIMGELEIVLVFMGK